MWPNVKRFEPLIDCLTNELVIVADINNVPDLQTKTIEHSIHHKFPKRMGNYSFVSHTQ